MVQKMVQKFKRNRLQYCCVSRFRLIIRASKPLPKEFAFIEDILRELPLELRAYFVKQITNKEKPMDLEKILQEKKEVLKFIPSLN